MKFKGIRFKSYDSPPSSKGLPRSHHLLKAGEEYNAHDKRKARLRHLRQHCLRATKSKDPEVQAALSKLRDLTKGEPEPEYGFLHLLHNALQSHDDTGAPLKDCLLYLVEKFSETTS